MQAENSYMYMFIRNDLTPAQQIIQTAHAVDTVNKKFPHETDNHMVLIGVEDEEELFDVHCYLIKHDIDQSMFFESDISEYTAIATVPLVGDCRKPLRNYRTKI